MPEIAIVETSDCDSGCYECSGHTFAQSITSWDTVTDAELATIRKYYSGLRPIRKTYWILERIQAETALTTVRKELDAAKREEEKKEKRKQHLAAEKLRKEKEKAEKAAKKERETFEKLRKKFEGEK